ncbi:MAG: phage integrase family protein [Thermoplasmatales archaeon E-plasma]|nr:MAG: phage integrase family protein [Thermoplasmatales archaeon E-plasma]
MSENVPDLDLKLNDFYLERVGKGDALQTAERRARRIRFLDSRIDISKPDIKALYSYIESRQRDGIKKKTLRIEMMDLQYWYRFLGFQTSTPRLKKEPSPDPFLPTTDQLQRILKFCDSHHNKEVWLRNRFDIEILAYSGMRIGEMQKVNMEDIKEGMLYIRSEKGERDRYVPLPDDFLNRLEGYIKNYRMQSDQRSLFTSDQGRMPYTYLRTMIKKIGIKTGMPELHAHSFRHFYGTNMYRTTNDLRMVQILLGHARIETTTIYEHLSSKEAAEKGKLAVEKLFRGSEKMTLEDQIPAGAVATKWEHWDLNPDLRVSSRFLVPVTHHESDDPLLNIP